jgi:hypothetical protein
MKPLLLALPLIPFTLDPLLAQQIMIRERVVGGPCQGWAYRQEHSILGEGEEVVIQVTPGLPAAVGGLRVGDMILSRVQRSAGPYDRHTPPRPGDTIVFRVHREGSEAEVRVVVGELQEGPAGLVCQPWTGRPRQAQPPAAEPVAAPDNAP